MGISIIRDMNYYEIQYNILIPITFLLYNSAIRATPSFHHLVKENLETLFHF